MLEAIGSACRFYRAAASLTLRVTMLLSWLLTLTAV